MLLLGGTSESRAVVSLLLQKKRPFILTTTTHYDSTGDGTEDGKFEHLVTRFSRESMLGFLLQRRIDQIIDATHPFAEQISKLAISLSEEGRIKYVRYERDRIEIPERFEINKVNNREEALEVLSHTDGNIFLTTGVQSLDYFSSSLTDRLDQVFIRVLPLQTSLAECERCGIKPSHIVAMQGPFDDEMNRYLLKKFNIAVMVTKDTGLEGGLQEKIDACLYCGVRLVIIEPPQVDYPVVVHEIGQLEKWLTE
jgi:precorrin-6A/cobalt-precorrin-6A reductase